MKAQVIKHNTNKEYFFEEGCFIIELSNNDDDPHLSIAQARVEPGVTTHLHKLSDTTERYIILKGQGLINIDCLTKQTVKQGDVVLIPAGFSQQITNTGESDLIFLAICSPRFSPDKYSDAATYL